MKSVALFYLNCKAELDPGHVPASEIEIVATIAIVPKISTLDRVGI